MWVCVNGQEAKSFIVETWPMGLATVLFKVEGLF